jgi:tetratricopeptide (TPR) repeat protein
MPRVKRILLVVLTAAALAAGEPPYRRVLQGDDAKKAAELDKRINELWAAGKFAEAVAPAEELLALRRRAQGERHWEAADAARLVQTLRQAARLPAARQQALAAAPSVQTRAAVLQAQGKYTQAEALFRQALAVWEETLGPKHPRTAAGCNFLAMNLQQQGRLQEAEQLFRKSMALREEALGTRHPDTVSCYSNLAFNVETQGRFHEAELLYRKAIGILEEVLGPTHVITAGRYDGLAGNLQAQGRAHEAEPLFRRALILRQQAAGPGHPLVAQSCNNLALNLDAQGRYKEAEPLYRRALAIWEAVFGPKDVDTALGFHNLAGNLAAQGRLREAEELTRKALPIWEEVRGPKDAHTATSYSNLASYVRAQGRAKEAETLFRKALAVWEEGLGPKHPLTALGYNNLAADLQDQGRLQDAEPLFRKALALREEVLGARHPDTATGYHWLALNLHAQGRTDEAQPLWKAAADGVEAARLRLAGSTLHRARAVRSHPHVGLAACCARLGRPADAWAAAEAGLARGLLDDLAARVALPADPQTRQRDGERATRLQTLDRLLTPLLTRQQLDDEQRRRRDTLLRERTLLDTEVAEAAAERSRRAVLGQAEVQAALAADTALVFWVDLPQTSDHWGCVLRHSGPPAWVRLQGSGPDGAWAEADDKLQRRLRDSLDHGEPDADRRAAALAEQRLRPLEPHLAATDKLPAVQHLLVVPAGRMAGIPVELLCDRCTVSYVPSGSVLSRLRQKHRPLEHPSLLAVGDPNFRTPDAGAPPKPPEYGLYLALVLPDGNAARAGLRGGDVLLSYGGTKLITRADLKIAEGGDRVPVVVWRDGKTLDDLRLAPGKLGVAVSEDRPAVALSKRRDLELLADARSRGNLRPLPGTRLEVRAITGLLPRDKATVLLGSKASEQELAARAAAGKLKEHRILHLATHGKVDPISAAHSALELARDQLPGPEEQAKLAVAGKKVPTGRLSVGDIADSWDLDADLVVLSACQTALGPDGGGEGLLGFAQVLLGKGARSLVLSLWKVDDTATALLMARFYHNLLGKTPLPKAQALDEAKHWLRTLPRAEVEKLAGELARGSVRAGEDDPAPKGPAREAAKPAVPAGDRPFAHPSYWAAFILIGDPQ